MALPVNNVQKNYLWILAICEDYATRSKFIRYIKGTNVRFGVGLPDKINEIIKETPYMWISDEGTTMIYDSNNLYTSVEHTIRVYIADKEIIDETNQNNAANSTKEELMAMVAEFRQHPYYLANRMQLIGNVNIITEYEVDDDLLVRSYCELTIKVPFQYTYCSNPTDAIPLYNNETISYFNSATVSICEIVRSCGTMGPTGSIGATGPQGPQGLIGPQGFTGAQGPTGLQGATGANGSTGSQGFQGQTGSQGPQGDRGFQGVAGPQGFQGATGANGLPGSQGFQGPTGPQGFIGATGPQGRDGSQGATGPTGANGLPGLQGPQGNQGFQGATGSNGATGVQGATGATGSTGVQGPQGTQGNQGFQGATGATGPQGFQGNVGPQGNQGFQGATGATGSQGPAGPQGNQGFQGATGATGAQGFQGPAGPQGVTGSQGPTGPNTGSGANTQVATWTSATNITGSSALTFASSILNCNSSVLNGDVIVKAQNIATTASSRAAIQANNSSQSITMYQYGPNYATASLILPKLSSIESTSGVGLLFNIGGGGYWWNVNSTATPSMSLTASELLMTATTIKLGVGTTALPPLKFQSGTNLTAITAGVHEYDGNNHALTCGTLRGTVPRVLFTQTADKTVTNTLTETSIIGTGSAVGGGMTLAANALVSGRTLRLRIGGVYSTPLASTPSLVIKVKYGSTTIATVTTSGLLSGATNLEFDGEILITCRTAGASGTVMVHGDIEYATGVAGTISVDSLNNAGATTTIDTTGSNLIDVTVTWDTATSTRIAKSTISVFEVLN